MTFDTDNSASESAMNAGSDNMSEIDIEPGSVVCCERFREWTIEPVFTGGNISFAIL